MKGMWTAALLAAAIAAPGAASVQGEPPKPSQIVVKSGQPIRLHFVGVQGTSHHIHLEGDGVDEKFALERGNLHTVELKPEKAGIIEIECYDHQPSMRGEIVVLPQ